MPSTDMPQINHVFVLMLENRSFDHMLGFSGLTGTDAASGQPTKIAGLAGSESNNFNGQTYTVATPAGFTMSVDPAHEFPDVLQQLAGTGAQYLPNGTYPPVNNSGYAANFAGAGGQNTPGEVMKCFLPAQLPVLNALAKNFAVCDHWFCSMPGPTWPNRFFLLAGSSGGLDHSPTSAEMIEWESVSGFKFQNGTVFQSNLKWRIYAGGDFCLAHALQGIHILDITPFSRFNSDVADANYPAQFTLIEPNYGHVVSDYKDGTSQHPLDDVTSGEGLIKSVYESIRNSPLWPNSMLIVTWDEHGGFFDHGVPPSAVAPGDAARFASANKLGFNFQQLGPRVVAVVASPLIPANLIDHRVYDHTSVLATVHAAFGVPALTQRDAAANPLLALATLPSARGDAPTALPAPARPAVANAALSSANLGLPAPPPTRPADPIESQASMPGFLYVVMRNDLDLSPPEQRPAILARVAAIRTRNDAHLYIEDVRKKVHVARAAQ